MLTIPDPNTIILDINSSNSNPENRKLLSHFEDKISVTDPEKFANLKEWPDWDFWTKNQWFDHVFDQNSHLPNEIQNLIVDFMFEGTL